MGGNGLAEAGDGPRARSGARWRGEWHGALQGGSCECPWNEGPAVVLERALQSEQVQSVLNAIERDRR